jgi:serine/threonine protein kinase
MYETRSGRREVTLYLQLLDGVEAAHLLGAVHRDLKPENVLWEATSNSVAVADFGVASLAPDLAATVVDTKPDRRLANFNYAAPEQRTPGREVTATADIYALGLLLNEMFTSAIAHGQKYKTIASVAPKFAYLDDLVESMLAQAPTARPASIAEVKGKIEFLGDQEVIRQKISKIDGTVVPSGEVDNPLAREAPSIARAEYRDGDLIIEFDRPLNRAWIEVLQHHMGNMTYIVHPSQFEFRERSAFAALPDHLAQQIVDLFKQWLPQATQVLNARLQYQLGREKEEREARLREERAREAERLRTNRSLRI